MINEATVIGLVFLFVFTFFAIVLYFGLKLVNNWVYAPP